jgi:hypothetical protein
LSDLLSRARWPAIARAVHQCQGRNAVEARKASA